MGITFEKGYGLLAPHRIDSFEKTTGVVLPETYKSFLLHFNGGHPVPDRFAVPGWYGGFSGVNRFFGIHDGKYNNLERAYSDYADHIPNGFLAIGSDPGGNLICLGINSTHAEKIFFWDHEDELDEHGEIRMDMGNMYELADNIEVFINEALISA